MLPGVFFPFLKEIDAVQDLSVTVADSVASGVVTPSPAVDWERTIIVPRGHVNTFGAGVSGDLAASTYYLDVTGTDVRLTKSNAPGDGNTTAYFTLVTFKPGVIRKITRGTIANILTNTGTLGLSAAVDLSKVELRFLGAFLNTSINAALSRVEMQDASTVKHTGGNGASSATASFELVERY